MKFCTDFSIFPDLINKSDGHRIFMNLAIINNEVSRFNDSSMIKFKDKSFSAFEMNKS